MILYLVKGYLDLAATTLADAQALLTALANPALASNQAIIDKVTGKLETLVQSDSGEPLTISSIDDTAGSYSAWVTDAQTTLAVGLGLPNTSTLDTYASTTSFSITGNTRTGTLALNTRELSNGLLRGGLRLQIRTTNSAGAAETRALLRINVVPGVLESPVGDRDVDYTSYVEVAALATAAAASAAAATTAETNAETAETNAETAQAAAAISAAAALVSENAASASASTATTQAGTATTQAGTATTQAGIATTQAGLAAAAKTAAETAETNAETAETNAAASATAAGISAAAALVSEAAALVSKNAAAASAATASAVSGSGNGTFSAAALTGVNSITASASTALTLTGGSTGASLVLGQGTTAGSATTTITGSGTAVTRGPVRAIDATTLGIASISSTDAQAAGRGGSLTLGGFRNDAASEYRNFAALLGGKENSTTGNATGYLGFYTNNNGALPEIARLTSTGNLLIGTTTDAASLAGGLIVNGSGAGAAASSTTTGALRVAGGVGVSGAVYAGGNLTALGTATIGGAAVSDPLLVTGGGGGNIIFRLKADQAFYLSSQTVDPATAGATLKNSVANYFRGGYWNGSASVQSDAVIQHVITSTTPTSKLTFQVPAGTEIMSLASSGAAAFAGAVTANGQLIGKGTATNDSAATGYIGEYVENSTANTSGTAVSLTTNTVANVSSISLTAGDWDVSCVAYFVVAGGSATAIAAGITQTSATFGGTGSYAGFTGTIAQTTFADNTQSVPVFRVKLTGTTTVYLVARSTFPGTCSSYGMLSARRVR